METRMFSFETSEMREEREKKEKEQGFWIGPYGCRVDDCINFVVWVDGYSKYKRNKRLTDEGPLPTFAKDKWLEIYTRLDEDGILHYVPPSTWPTFPRKVGFSMSEVEI